MLVSTVYTTKDVISQTTKGPLELKITASASSCHGRGHCAERLRRWPNVTQQPAAGPRLAHSPLLGPPAGPREGSAAWTGVPSLFTQHPAW